MAPATGLSLLSEGLAITDIASSKSNITTSVHEIPSPTFRPNTLVLNPAFITQDFDALRFEVAAYNQLPSPDSTTSTPDSGSDASPAYSTNLISSPYNNPGHYLDLSSLDTTSRLFALALTSLKPTRPDYATADYTASLNFDHVLAVLQDLITREAYTWKETSFYVVVFRSKLNAHVDQEWLYKLDYESHREACESGGLLKYWFGKADLGGGSHESESESTAERRNLATCFWRSREDAFKGGLGPWHAKARAAGRELYERIVFSTHRFTVLDAAEGYRFEDWKS